MADAIMYVMTECKGNGATGLRVGIRNVRRFFPDAVSSIDLDLGHLRIQCELTPQFWNGDPAIHDPRLCAWLEAKHLQPRCGRQSAPMTLTPLGENAFRLEAIDRDHLAQNRNAEAAVPRDDCSLTNLSELVDSEYEAVLRAKKSD